MNQKLFNVWKEFKFDAAHRLDGGPEGDPKYRTIHGHSYQVEVWVRGPRNDRGWVVDMGELEKQLEAVRQRLDHQFLNEIEGLSSPTMENIAEVVWNALERKVPLHRVSVKRGQSGQGCEYFGPSEG